ncbi:MAG TPA: UbiA family prenyltransferase [Anaerolineales bacterium]|nr:UbiA family prenyltransferase [Anaerolineales bacterium]
MRKFKLFYLFTNHIDAWGLALGIAIVVAYLHEQLTWRAFILAGVIAFGYWLAFAMNDYFDRQVDQLDSQKARRNFFCMVALTPKQQFFYPSLLALAWLIIAGGLGMWGWRGWLALLVCLTISWSYSAPPIRLKSRAGLDLLTHVGFVETFPYLLMLFLLKIAPNQTDGLLLCILLVASACAQLEQQIRDYDSEVQVERNLTTRIGKSWAVSLLKWLSITYLALGWIGFGGGWLPTWLLPLASLSVPVFIWRLFLRIDGSYPTYLPKTRPYWLTILILITGFSYLFILILLK